MARAVLGGLGALLLAGCATVPAPSPCAMSANDRSWLTGALQQWQSGGRAWLRLDPAPLPEVVVIDASCTYTLPEGRVADATAVAHDGKTVDLGAQQVPLGPISFADGSGRFVMSLPSVWRAAGVTSTIDFDVFLEGVMLHEIMHTRQTALATAALSKVEKLHGAAVNDDQIQKEFSDDADYVRAFEAERDLLFAAANAKDEDEARQLASRALRMMRDRRARWFTGDHAYYNDLDDVFLTMEGMGQLLMYRHFRRHPDIPHSAALTEATRGNYWTQSEGLALFLALDRLLPDWQERAFREPDWRAQELLAAATGEKP